MRSQALASEATVPRRDPATVLASSTFSAGLGLLPAALHADAHRLYCLLRTIDDLVDEQHPEAGERVEALERWAHTGELHSPEAQTLSELSRRYPLTALP